MTLTSRKLNTKQHSDAISSWNQFTSIVRSQGCNLLARLDDFPDAVLVTGCQRSGTTILSRIITQSKGMKNYWIGSDDELDAALILSGHVDHKPSGRYCFQTTYLDECYHEYLEHKGAYKMIWVIRNPYSVVYSLIYNWAPGALEGTFKKTAAHLLYGLEKFCYSIFGSKCINQTKQACLLYKAKTLQLLYLKKQLNPDQVFVVDYDEMVLHKNEILPQIYSFIDLEFNPDYAGKLHSQSLQKKSKLSAKQVKTAKMLAEPIYNQAQRLICTSIQK